LERKIQLLIKEIEDQSNDASIGKILISMLAIDPNNRTGFSVVKRYLYNSNFYDPTGLQNNQSYQIPSPALHVQIPVQSQQVKPDMREALKNQQILIQQTENLRQLELARNRQLQQAQSDYDTRRCCGCILSLVSLVIIIFFWAR